MLSPGAEEEGNVNKDKKDKPEAGKVYSLTGLGPSIANGNTWAESVVPELRCPLCLSPDRDCDCSQAIGKEGKREIVDARLTEGGG